MRISWARVCGIGGVVAVGFGVGESVRAEAVSLIPVAQVWRYEDSGVDLGTSWREATFDDSAWSSGAAYLGYGEQQIVTRLSYGDDPDNRHITSYLRHTFTVDTDPVDFQRMLLGTYSDDAFVAYLNGVEVARENLPAGAVTASTLALIDSEGRAFPIVDLTPHLGLLVPGDNVLAVELHQNLPSSSDLLFDAELSVSTDAVIAVRHPYLQQLSPTSVVVRWRLDTAAACGIRYGVVPDGLPEFVATPSGIEHEVLLTGLTPDTEYCYTIESGEDTLTGLTAAHVFRTHPVTGEPDASTRIWVTGDTGAASPEARLMRDDYFATSVGIDTDVWLNLGDLAYNEGTDDQFTGGFFNTFRDVTPNYSIWPARGNHEELHPGELDYYGQFTLPTGGEAGGVPSGTEAYYSFDHGDVHFVCLDSEGTDPSPGLPMHDWLVADLTATDQPWIIAFFHHPPYTKGTHNSDNDSDSGGRMRAVRENLVPTLDEFGVDLALTGHSHAYERSPLIRGHYDVSATFDSTTMIVDGGDGSVTGDGAYTKVGEGPIPQSGIVHAVVGNSSRSGGGPFNHPAMLLHYQGYGSMTVTVTGKRLDAVYVNEQGVVIDDFTIEKNPDPVTVPNVGAPMPKLVVMNAGSSGPSRIRYTVVESRRITLRVHDIAGRTVSTLVDGLRPAGLYEVTWSGVTDAGRPVAAGVYLLDLRAGSDRARARIVRLR